MSDGDFLHDRTANISNRNVVIPVSQLQEETLNNILEEFITREGTDYGDYEISLQQKVDKLKRQIAQGDVGQKKGRRDLILINFDHIVCTRLKFHYDLNYYKLLMKEIE